IWCNNGEIAEGSSDMSGNKKSVSKDIAPGEGGILLVNSSKKRAVTEFYVDNKVETGKETSIFQKLTKTVTNNMQSLKQTVTLKDNMAFPIHNEKYNIKAKDAANQYWTSDNINRIALMNEDENDPTQLWKLLSTNTPDVYFIAKYVPGQEEMEMCVTWVPSQKFFQLKPQDWADKYQQFTFEQRLGGYTTAICNVKDCSIYAARSDRSELSDYLVGPGDEILWPYQSERDQDAETVWQAFKHNLGGHDYYIVAQKLSQELNNNQIFSVEDGNVTTKHVLSRRRSQLEREKEEYDKLESHISNVKRKYEEDSYHEFICHFDNINPIVSNLFTQDEINEIANIDCFVKWRGFEEPFISWTRKLASKEAVEIPKIIKKEIKEEYIYVLQMYKNLNKIWSNGRYNNRCKGDRSILEDTHLHLVVHDLLYDTIEGINNVNVDW
ncbi:14945_t:CDS:2, partial [Acaulospora morrowiae]